MKHTAFYSTLKMEVIYHSETSVKFHRTIRRYILEDIILHKHCFENPRSDSRYFIYNNPPLDPTSHTVTPCLIKIDRSNLLHLCLPTGLFLSGILTRVLYVSRIAPCMLHVPSILSSFAFQCEGQKNAV
jgi:hypothetical protein